MSNNYVEKLEQVATAAEALRPYLGTIKVSDIPFEFWEQINPFIMDLTFALSELQAASQDKPSVGKAY